MHCTLPTLIAAALLAPHALPQCQVVWSNAWSNWTSHQSFTQPGYEREVADDFDLAATIVRVQVDGKSNAVIPPPILGAAVRFYDWAPSGPGALQAEYLFATGDAGFATAPIPGSLDFQLPVPFVATGQHFLSVQVAFENQFGGWSWWSANHGSIDGAPTHARENGGPWFAVTDFFGNADTDARFTLYGDDGSVVEEAGCGTWLEVPSPGYFSDHNVLRDVAAIAPDDVWAIGESRVDGETVGLAMHWDGGSWTLHPVPHPTAIPGNGWVDLLGITAVAPDDVWAAGSKRVSHPIDGFLGSQAFVIHWDGSSWSEVPAPFTPAGCTGATVYGIEAFGPDDIWFVGETCGVSGSGWQPALAMHWDGSGFTLHELPFIGIGGHGLEDVAGTGPDDVWAVGGGGDGDTWAQSVIYHWDGDAWSHVPGPVNGLQRFSDVAALAPDDVWATGERWGPGVVDPLVQHWDGSSWSDVPAPTGGGGIAAIAPDDIWISGSSFAHWDGSAFTLVPALGCVPGPSLGALAAVGPCDVWAVGRKVTADLQSLTAHLTPSWADLGGGLAGATGVPQLSAHGSLLAGSTVRLELTDAAPSAPAGHVIGASRIDLPFFGGVLVPAPDALVLVTTSGTGDDLLELPVPNTPAVGTEVYVQAWVLDPGAVQLVSGSNARLAVAAP